MTKNTYPRRASKPGRVSLIPGEFDNLVVDQGIMVRITPSVLCPRRSGNDVEEDSVNHDLNCTLCDGMIIDLHEHAVEDWAFIQSISLDRTYDPASRFDVKDAMMTTRARVRLAYWYKVEIIDFGSQFNELIKRSPKAGVNIDKLRYPAVDGLEDYNIFSLIDGEGITYAKDVDYRVDGQEIEWIGGTPAAGRLYSILYPILPTFRILEMPHENRYYYDQEKSPVKVPEHLPQQAHIRWDYMARGSGSDPVIAG